jgi:hypothetical protein
LRPDIPPVSGLFSQHFVATKQKPRALSLGAFVSVANSA